MGLKNDELVKGSLILFVMITIFNVLNYVFHFSMAHLLSPADYGTLAVLMSILYIFGIPTEAIQTVVTRYASRFNAKKQYGKIKDLFYRSSKKGLLFAFVIFVVFLPIAWLLSPVLNINFSLLFLADIFVFYVFMIPITRGIMQGQKKFSSLGMNMIAESAIKIALAVAFVMLNFSVYGAIGGIVIGGVFTFFLAFLPISKVLKSRRKSGRFDRIYSYSMPVTISMISIVLMYSMDIILAKAFFSAELAGKYAVLSMLGKMILFGTFAIGKTMFPLASENFEKGKNTMKIFIKSMKIVSLLSAVILLVYLLFPKQAISILFGPAYSDVYSLLFIVALSYTFVSVANIIILYKLSLNKIRKSSFALLIFALLQIMLLSIFNASLMQFSLALLISDLFLLVYSIIIIRNKK